MYSGRIVEAAPVHEFFGNPAHPYTVGLLRCLPRSMRKAGRLETIKGSMPTGINPPHGCRFHPRCSMAKPICKKKIPEPVELEKGHLVSCHLYG